MSEQAVTDLYEALLWISEYPNRHPEADVYGVAVDLAEHAREAIVAFDSSALSPHDPKDVRPDCPCPICALVRRTLWTFGSQCVQHESEVCGDPAYCAEHGCQL